jgi:hypothetical protein
MNGPSANSGRVGRLVFARPRGQTPGRAFAEADAGHARSSARAARLLTRTRLALPFMPGGGHQGLIGFPFGRVTAGE